MAECRHMILLMLGIDVVAQLCPVSTCLVRLLSMRWASIPLRLMLWCGLWPMTLISLVMARMLLLIMRFGACPAVVISLLPIISSWRLLLVMRPLMTIRRERLCVVWKLVWMLLLVLTVTATLWLRPLPQGPAMIGFLTWCRVCIVVLLSCISLRCGVGRLSEARTWPALLPL